MDKEYDLDIVFVSIFSGVMLIGLIVMTGAWVEFRNEYCNAIGMELFGKPLTWFQCLVI